LKLLFAADVPFRCLYKGVAKQKLNLFQFSSTTMAQAGASATKVMRCHIGYASLIGALHRIPNNIALKNGPQASKLNPLESRIGIIEANAC
jgi:hypothetical protein